MPSIFGLAALLDMNVPPPAPLLPEGHPFRNVSQYYPTTAGVHAWCVRGPSADSRY